MGVHGLWKVLEPSSRPVLLESLRGKTLAIDASIWIYHFLKAMRDSSGNAMKAGHIIGFFRRICKLLFYEIRPVFIFDGPAPLIKRVTTERRKKRATQRASSAKQTANKLLTIQLQRLNEKEDAAKKPKKTDKLVKGSIPQNASYTTSENEPFMPQDQYDLPYLQEIQPIRLNDQRLLTEEELDEYAKEFSVNTQTTGFVDTDSIDFKSPQFQLLPIEQQYQLLNQARLKSRLRMGYTSSQLGRMFPNSMEFSKFQIDRVAQRNFFTQKLMNIVGLEDDLSSKRVSSEKGREYMLQKSQGGYTLSLGTHGSATKTADTNVNGEPEETLKSESEDDFEDVDLEPAQVPESSSASNAIRDTSRDVPGEHDLRNIFGWESELQRAHLYKSKDTDVQEHPTKRKAKDDPDDSDDEIELPPWFQASSNRPEPAKSEPKISEVDLIHYGPTGAADDGVKNMLHGSALFRSTPSPKKLRTERSKPETNVLEAAESSSQKRPDFIEHNDIATPIEPLRAGDLSDETHEADEPGIADAFDEEPANKVAPSSPKVEVEDQREPVPSEAQGVNVPKEPSQEAPPSATSPSRQSLDLVESENQSEVLPNEARQEVNASKAPSQEGSSSVNRSGDLIDKEDLDPKNKFKDTADNQLTDEPAEIDLTDEPVDLELAEEEAQYDDEQVDEIQNVIIEELEENERFMQELAKGQQRASHIAEIESLKEVYRQEKRDADAVTMEMVSECMELLQIFGIPYVTAPGEAEAQCAALYDMQLVDGIVTDDGDCFLFGDVKVYRNLFNQAKYVEAYDSAIIQKELGLDRNKLISLAYLLGSDYTDGIVGIGPVTGVELLADFDNLKAFRDWWTESQPNPQEADTTSTFKKRFLKRFAKKLFLPEAFPVEAVADAYLKPEIDPDNTEFQWGRPEVDSIRKFMRITAGWDAETVNKLILPVVEDQKRRDLLRKQTGHQATLDEFAQINKQFRSKRAATATEKLAKSS